MAYYEVMGFKQEPFSTAPDPKFFYRSHQHEQALDRLEIAIRLRRGLNLVLGDVGTGKTTLSLILLQQFAGEEDYLFYSILDPVFPSEFQFLSALAEMFGVQPKLRSTYSYKSAIEDFLFEKGVDESRAVILVIDEGQKLTPSFIETLRVFLNFETNDAKLLQLVIFAQEEFREKIRRRRNFVNRINVKYTINPLSFQETKEMILTRMRIAGLDQKRRVFSDRALDMIADYSSGIPRTANMLCHHALALALMAGDSLIKDDLVQQVIDEDRSFASDD